MNSGLAQAYSQLNIMYIDTYPWDQLQTYCHGASATTIVQSIQNRLASLNNDPLVAGWLLVDDYPGCDITALMNDVHTRVQALNVNAPFPRPTICDFGGWMDNKANPTDPTWTAHHVQWDEALVNFSSTACDAVFLYPEGMNTPANYGYSETIDWSMGTLLPYVLNALRVRGWDSSKQPLIGGPPVYDWTPAYWQSLNVPLWKPLPRAEDIATQVEAFCQAGAVSINPYAWNDPFHSAADKYELFNYAPFLTGYKMGIAQCQTKYWRPPPPPVPSQLYTVVPCRLVDTRNIGQGAPALVAGLSRTFAAVGGCGVPSDARAVVVNITVTAPSAAGHLRFYPAGAPLPTISTLNYSAGQTRANNAVLALGATGAVTVYCGQGAGTAHLIVDVSGYFR